MVGRLTEHHQGPFDKLTLWQPWGDKVAPSSLHGVKSAKCYTAVSFPGALVLHRSVSFHRDNPKKNQAHPRETKCKLWNQTKLVALNFQKAKLINNNYAPCFTAWIKELNCMNSAFICFPHRFALSTPPIHFWCWMGHWWEINVTEMIAGPLNHLHVQQQKKFCWLMSYSFFLLLIQFQTFCQ